MWHMPPILIQNGLQDETGGQGVVVQGVLKWRGDSWDGKERKMCSVFLSQNQSLLAPCWCDRRTEEPKMAILSKLSENVGG